MGQVEKSREERSRDDVREEEKRRDEVGDGEKTSRDEVREK